MSISVHQERNKLSSGLRGQRVFLTGHRGFIGSTLCGELKRHCCTVTLCLADITAPDAWVDLNEDFDFVLHLAAIENSANLERELSINALSVFNLARHIAPMKKKPKVIFTSSTNIWGGRTVVVDEQTIDSPASTWSAHKLLAENYLRTFREYGIKSVVLRLPNIYGQCANKAVIRRSAVNRAIEDCILGNTLTVYANRDCIRDYLDVSDLVDILIRSVHCFDELSQHDKIIIGSGQCVRIIQVWREIAQQYENLTGAKIDIKESTASLNASAMRSYVSNNALGVNILGYKPKISMEECIKGTLQYFVDLHKSNPYPMLPSHDSFAK